MAKLLWLTPFVAACAPALITTTMTNPSKTQEKIENAQEYDIGPVKENHRYRLVLRDWTPQSIAAQIKLVDVGPCAQPKSYTFTLVNDRGARYDMKASGDPTVATEKGTQELTLDVVTVTGVFAAPISGDDKAVTVEMRPLDGTGCPSIDFRWNLQ